jgi:hypothetical protein
MIIYTDIIKLIMHKTYRIKNVPSTFHAYMEILTDSKGEIVDPVYSPEFWETYRTSLPIYILVNMYKNKVDFTFVSRDDMVEVYVYLYEYVNYLKSFGDIPFDHAEFYEDLKPFMNLLAKKCSNMAKTRAKSDVPRTLLDNIRKANLVT